MLVDNQAMDRMEANVAGKLETILDDGGLMIVESPTKAREITKFLPSNHKWKVVATLGFMFELKDPKRLTDKEREQGRDYSVRLDDGSFERFLERDPQNSKNLTSLKADVQSGKWKHFYVSTDPDEAGELIGREVVEYLENDLKRAGMDVRRASWHEITRKAVEAGLQAWGKIDENKADSAEARQVYDRLFGFSASHWMWRVKGGKSGGRAQSPCLRLIVDREKERLAFVKASYAGIEALVNVSGGDFTASLKEYGGKKLATGASYGSDGKLKNPSETLALDEKKAKTIAADLKKRAHTISDVQSKPYTRRPPVPYTTSTFQQDVGNRLGMGSKQLMQIAQKLFESGSITYMRTDSCQLSNEATMIARHTAESKYGAAAVPAKPRFFKNTKKNVQEGHEAIRPATQENGGFLDPSNPAVRRRLDSIIPRGSEVYELVWKRTIACQMNDASGVTTIVSVKTKNAPVEKTGLFTASGTVINKLGWMQAYGRAQADYGSQTLPEVENGADAILTRLTVSSHETTPPARYTEPQLVAKLEELGIGRPSTYANIVTVNQNRGYVRKQGKALVPTWAGMKAAQLIEGKLTDYVAYDYTAGMEDKLDEIAQGKLSKTKFLSDAWAGVDKDVNGLAKNVDWDEINKLSTISLPSGYQVRVNGDYAFLEDPNTEPGADGRRIGARIDDDTLSNDGALSEIECAKLLKTAEKSRDMSALGRIPDGRLEGWTIGVNPKGKFGPYAYAIELDDDGKKKRGVKLVNVSLPAGVDAFSLKLADLLPYFTPRTLGKLSDGPYTGWTVEVIQTADGPAVQAVKTLKNGKTDFKEKPVSRLLADVAPGKNLNDVSLSDVEAVFSEVKLPRWFNNGASKPVYGVGVGKRGPWMARKTSPTARRAVFKSLPDGLDPHDVTLEQVEEAWAAAPASKPRKSGSHGRRSV